MELHRTVPRRASAPPLSYRRGWDAERAAALNHAPRWCAALRVTTTLDLKRWRTLLPLADTLPVAARSSGGRRSFVPGRQYCNGERTVERRVVSPLAGTDRVVPRSDRRWIVWPEKLSA